MFTFTVSIPPTYMPCSQGYDAEQCHAVPMLSAEVRIVFDVGVEVDVEVLDQRLGGEEEKRREGGAYVRKAAWVTAWVFAVTMSWSS